MQRVKTHPFCEYFQDMKPGGSDEYLSASPSSTGLAPDDADIGGVNTPESPIPETNLYTTQSSNEDSSYSDKTNVQDQNVHDTVKSPDTERVGETFVKDDNDEMASSRETIATSHADEYSDNDRLGVSDKGDDDLDGVQKSDVDTDVKIESKNSEEEIRRRMVSDKLIPEVKLTFNVNTDTEVSQSQTSRETGKVGDVKWNWGWIFLYYLPFHSLTFQSLTKIIPFYWTQDWRAASSSLTSVTALWSLSKTQGYVH